MYDLHVEVLDEKTLDFSEMMGWQGLCLLGSDIAAKPMKSRLDLANGILISRKPEEARKSAVSLRKKIEIIAARGGTPDLDRKICETPEIDILVNPGDLDHVMAKLAKKNSVSIEFNFHDLLISYKKSRCDVFSRMLENAKLVKKYKAPFVLTSGALSPWDLRSPSELISFGRVLGFRDPEIKHSLSGSILKENRKRLGVSWIMPGVEKKN